MNQSPNNGGGRGKPMAAASMFPSPAQRPPAVTASSAGTGSPLGLTRYDSAPGSFLDDSIVGGGAGGGGGRRGGGGGAATEVAFMGRFLTTQSPCMTSESSCKVSAGPAVGASSSSSPPSGPQRLPYGMSEFAASELTMGTSRNGGGDGGSLMRHSSSPAGFLSRLMVDNGFSGMRDSGSYPQAGTDATNSMANGRLKSQLSFPNRSNLSQISGFSIPDIGESVGHRNHSDGNSGNVGRPYVSGNFSIGSWDENNSIMFSSSSSKRAKDANGDIITISNLEPEYGFAKSSLDMSTVEKYLQMQHDQVQFKVRAKRGCATHPRSIAERERRTKISEKLRRLQELVPNMDKQTNTADMLDLALQHIKGLQSQLQILSQERDNCTCPNRKERN